MVSGNAVHTWSSVTNATSGWWMRSRVKRVIDLIPVIRILEGAYVIEGAAIKTSISAEISG